VSAADVRPRRIAGWRGLRGRLLAGTMALLTAGLLIADVTAYFALRTFLDNRVDRVLRAVTIRINEEVKLRAFPSINWTTIDVLSPSTQYVALAGPQGQILVVHVAVSGGDNLRPPLLPTPISAAPDHLVTLPSDGPGPGYRISVIDLPQPLPPATAANAVSRLPFQPTAVIVGTALDDTNATLDRLLFVELTSTVVILLAGILTALAVLDLGLRPLRRVAETARAIAGGQRDERIPEHRPHSEIGQVASALNAAFDERRRAEDRIRRFIADASHELRTPLTTIRGWSDLYLNGGITDWEKTDTAMERIQDESTRMQHLVEDLILLARLDARRPLERRPTDLALLAEGLAADLHTVDQSRAVTLSVRTRASTVLGDETSILQVLRNLLGNAARYTPAGSPIEITVDATGHAGAPAVLVAVIDHGPGLDEESIKRAFERFWRADNGRQAHGGSGLGLSIALEITEAHGGSLSLRTRAEGGLEARLILPVAGAI
jgi:two-component system OmpR family sensor kinase